MADAQQQLHGCRSFSFHYCMHLMIDTHTHTKSVQMLIMSFDSVYVCVPYEQTNLVKQRELDQ